MEIVITIGMMAMVTYNTTVTTVMIALTIALKTVSTTMTVMVMRTEMSMIEKIAFVMKIFMDVVFITGYDFYGNNDGATRGRKRRKKKKIKKKERMEEGVKGKRETETIQGSNPLMFDEVIPRALQLTGSLPVQIDENSSNNSRRKHYGFVNKFCMTYIDKIHFQRKLTLYFRAT